MKSHLFLLLALVALGILLLVPAAVLHPLSTLPDTNDTLLITYIINQVQINLLDPQKPLYWATFFSSYQDTLAYSDLFLTTATTTLPLRLLSVSPLLVYNFSLIASIFATSLTSFLLFHHLTRSPIASSTAALIFVFSGFHFAHLPHLQIFNLTFLPLCLYFLLKFLDSSKKIFLHGFLLCGLLQTLNSIFAGYLVVLASLILIMFHPRRSKILNLKSLIFFLPYFLLSLYILLPYLQLQFSFPEAQRPLTDAAHFAHSLDSMFTAYPALSTLFLIVLFFPRKISCRHLPWITLAFTSFILSLGPVLKISQHTFKLYNLPLPLPYALLYYTIPGFTGFRTPSRFVMLTLLGISALLALSLAKLHLPPKFKVLLPPLILVLLILNSPLPLPSYQTNLTPPAIYRQVKDLPPSAVILEWPPLLWNQPGNELESLRSLYSLTHQHRRFGGYSGFAPQSWINTVHTLQCQGLNPQTYQLLRSLGITHLLLPGRLFSL